MIDKSISSEFTGKKVVVTGDFTHDERRETYQAVRGLLEEWLDRCHVLPGNHDERALLREVFSGQAGGTDRGICFSQSLGGWRLLGIDTHVPGEVAGRVEPAMLDWLAGEFLRRGWAVKDLHRLIVYPQPMGFFLFHRNSVYYRA